MAKPRKAIEARFRRGSNFFILVGLFSALANTLLYWGFNFKAIKIFCLAIPVVLDTVVRVLPPRLWGEELHYYSYIFGLVLSGIFLLLGMASKFTSHTGTFLKFSSYLKPFASLGRFAGMTQLVGSRLFYFVGIILYAFDGILALVMENVLSAKFTDLRVIILMNLGFHCCVLVFLLYGFLAGLEAEDKPQPEAVSGQNDA
ncbi:hypothetical protein IV102_07110 [bacterium]|nr:hypothetical protein [bacterium]